MKKYISIIAALYAVCYTAQTNGNVGINTTAPKANLHVKQLSGKPMFRLQDGSEGAGKVLSAIDGSGNARWVPAATSPVIFATLGSTGPVTNGTLLKWQSFNSYIDLPPGRWIVIANFLINCGASYDITNTASTFVRASLADSSNTPSQDIVVGINDAAGSTLFSGTVSAPNSFGLVKGSIIVDNKTNATKRYTLVAYRDMINASLDGTQCFPGSFGDGSYQENRMFAIPANF